MSSVEEICDHIALINQSKKILDGQIDEVKERFKSNTFEITYKGESPNLQIKLGSHFDILEHDTNSHLKQLKIRFLNGNSNNDLLKILMDQFEIVSFKETIPSMNDVFIRVVEENNRQTKK